jgi:DNA polymerase I-like protein with 3'-5' exonuclease and polymerase domains
MQDKVTSTYEHALACAYHRIDNRGMLFDEVQMADLRYKIQAHNMQLLDELSCLWGLKVYVGAASKPAKGTDALNINASKQLLEFLKLRGFKLPLVRRKNKDTKEITFEESVEELILRKIYAETNDQCIRRILEVREYNTLKIRYVDSRRYEGQFFCNYGVANTVTGRRASRKHIFNLGGNAQTFPKHYELSRDFRSGIIARPGRLFFIVDQMSAEDWPVSALAGNTSALNELQQRVDRHSKLAAFMFGLPLDKITKDGIERYLGKKTRHANNYGMRGQTMSDSLAKEGKAYSKAQCDELLKKVNQHDPSISDVFHTYVRNQVFGSYILRNPFGRERHFHGLRQGEANYEIFNEAYSYIPQSTVGDNTGFAVLYLDGCNDYTINECHDSINQECPDNEKTIREVYAVARTAFDRRITFHNGITVSIPVEGELGFDMEHTVKIKDFTEENCVKAWKELHDKYGDLHARQQENLVCA